jgi:cytochrome c-type biogenesis protein CcmH/NrfG
VAPAKPAAPSPQEIRAQIDRHSRAAQAAFRRQDLTTSIQEWDKVLALDPNNDLARARRQEAIELDRRLKQLK